LMGARCLLALRERRAGIARCCRMMIRRWRRYYLKVRVFCLNRRRYFNKPVAFSSRSCLLEVVLASQREVAGSKRAVALQTTQKQLQSKQIPNSTEHTDRFYQTPFFDTTSLQYTTSTQPKLTPRYSRASHASLRIAHGSVAAKLGHVAGVNIACVHVLFT
jgi:hypothetical protein